jgi:hypothetical protein
MKLGQFVTTSSVVLAGWLGFTFVHEVPSQRYPKLKKYAEARPQTTRPNPTEPLKAAPAAEVFHVSVSH